MVRTCIFFFLSEPHKFSPNTLLFLIIICLRSTVLKELSNSFSNIPDNEKEPEMQIGYPTDVKHVAHIGWDGPSVNSPSWVNLFIFFLGPIHL